MLSEYGGKIPPSDQVIVDDTKEVSTKVEQKAMKVIEIISQVKQEKNNQQLGTRCCNAPPVYKEWEKSMGSRKVAGLA